MFSVTVGFSWCAVPPTLQKAMQENLGLFGIPEPDGTEKRNHIIFGT